MRLKVTLSKGAKTAVVFARPPNIPGGIRVISERSRRNACKKLFADWSDTNPRIESSETIRAVDSNGWHTFTIYGA